MDESERLAEQYLLSLKRGSVVYEPDGEKTPDFAFAGTIGVEVRRLNQNYEHPDGSMEGLEDRSISLWQKLKKLLPTIGPSIDGESWYVKIIFRRPIAKKFPRRRIQKKLCEFMTSTDRKQCVISVADSFDLGLNRASKDHGNFFLLGSSRDYDSGGRTMGEIEKNLKFCIEEKERKIANSFQREKYAEWWLILPDHIGYSMEPEDRNVFRVEIMPNLQHSFNKIILLDPHDHHRAFEV